MQFRTRAPPDGGDVGAQRAALRRLASERGDGDVPRAVRKSAHKDTITNPMRIDVIVPIAFCAGPSAVGLFGNDSRVVSLRPIQVSKTPIPTK